MHKYLSVIFFTLPFFTASTTGAAELAPCKRLLTHFDNYAKENNGAADMVWVINPERQGWLSSFIVNALADGATRDIGLIPLAFQKLDVEHLEKVLHNIGIDKASLEMVRRDFDYVSVNKNLALFDLRKWENQIVVLDVGFNFDGEIYFYKIDAAKHPMPLRKVPPYYGDGAIYDSIRLIHIDNHAYAMMMYRLYYDTNFPVLMQKDKKNQIAYWITLDRIGTNQDEKSCGLISRFNLTENGQENTEASHLEFASYAYSELTTDYWSAHW